MDFGSYVSGTTFGTKDLERQKVNKQAAREEEERLRFESKAFNINTFRNKLTACSLVVYKCVHLQMENSTNVCYLAHGGGRLVVSMLAFYFDNMSSNRGLQFFL